MASPLLEAVAANHRTEAEVRALRPSRHQPCPFCKSDAECVQRGNRFLVGCTNDDCWADAQTAGANMHEAWKLWDTRA